MTGYKPFLNNGLNVISENSVIIYFFIICLDKTHLVSSNCDREIINNLVFRLNFDFFFGRRVTRILD